MAASVAPVSSIRGMNYLIVSERNALTQGLAEALRSQGHQPVVQDSAAAAAEVLAAPTIDVVIIDGRLPGVNWELVRDGLAADRRTEPEPLDSVERRHIAATLRHTRGNRRNAAGLLGIARSTLLAKIRKYGLDRDPTLARS